VQVLLERGEVVQLVEQPTPGQPWVKIAPPAGEFRWIASRRLSRTPPVEGSPVPRGSWIGRPGTAKPGTVAALGANAVSTAAHVDDAPGGFSHLAVPSSTASTAPAVAATSPWRADPVGGNNPASAAIKPTDDIEVVEGSPAQVRLAQFQETTTAGAPPASATEVAPSADAPRSGPPRIRLSGVSPAGPVDPRVAELQIKLSQIVVQPPASWKLSALREETAALLAQEPSAPVREQLRDLLERIATFESVQGRYAAAPAVGKGPVVIVPAGNSPAAAAPAPPEGMTGQSAEVLARARADLGKDDGITPTPGGPLASTGGSAVAPAATEALYDAVGTLKPVVSRRDKAPHYALVDDHGDVVTFVTAAADVNLQPYVGKRIGVRGSRGFMPEYRRAHVTASRVTPLEEKLIK
jgi:hypothetical protein